MNDRIRQKIRAQLAMSRSLVMVVLRGAEEAKCSTIRFIDKDHVAEYRERYGDRMTIWGRVRYGSEYEN